ncbi:MAG TPA: lysophospholipid acyltransferase family protein [Nitrospirales bacterium]|jgi:1-acyl-sn-glycerol-3-phosphate acyltransferase
MALYWTVWIIVRGFARLLFHLQVSGQDHIPRTGGVLIAANHASYLDIPILGCALPRRASFIGRMDLFAGIVGYTLRYLGWIPIRRGRVDRKAFDEAVRRLKAGQVVVIYPEGTRTEDGQLQPGKPGIGIMAATAGCPVVPALLEGTYEALPPGAKWIRLRPIRVAFGKPMDFSTGLETESEDKKKFVYQQMSEEIMDRIAELRQQKSSHPNPLPGEGRVTGISS